MKHVRCTLLLLTFLFTQCQWNGNRSSAFLPYSPSVEERQDSCRDMLDSLIKELPVFPDDYFMTESNIMKEEGYKLNPQMVLPVLQQNKGIIVPTGDDTFVFKRTIGGIRVFLTGKWPVTGGRDYFILKCFTEESSVEVFIFSVIDNSIHASEWIASISDCGIGVNYNVEDLFIPKQIMSKRQGDSVIVYSFDTHKLLTEEFKIILTKNGELLFRSTNDAINSHQE